MTREEDRNLAARLVPHLETCPLAITPGEYDEFHCDCGTWEVRESVAQALTDARLNPHLRECGAETFHTSTGLVGHCTLPSGHPHEHSALGGPW